MPVILAGAGCASPRLLTEAAKMSLERADHIVFDRLIHPDLLLLAPGSCRFHPVGKRESDHLMAQEDINRLLVELGGDREKTVVRLKGGDPFVFGRGGEEAAALEAAGIPWTAIPGVTAALGGAVCAGLPLTHRGAASSLTLATAHRRSDADESRFWEDIARTSGTVAFYMGASAFAEASRRLTALGRAPETPCAAVVWGGWGRARTITGTLASLGEAARRGELPSPAIIYLGNAAALSLSPARGPLAGMQVALCRPYPACWTTGRFLEELGADAYGLPLLSLEPLEPVNLAQTREEIEGADWLVITSPRGPAELRRIAPNLRAIRGRIASIGEGTSRALREAGLPPDLTAGGTSEELARALASAVSAGERVVFARNERGSNAAVEAARAAGAEVRSVSTYRMMPRELPGLDVAREQWGAGGPHALVFGSAALVEAYAEKLGAAPPNAELVAWGTICAEAVKSCFGRSARRLSEPSDAGLVNELKRFYHPDQQEFHIKLK